MVATLRDLALPFAGTRSRAPRPLREALSSGLKTGVERWMLPGHPFSDIRHSGSHGTGWWWSLTVLTGAMTAPGAVTAEITSPARNINRRLCRIIAVLLLGSLAPY
jgi:hypothetical protein